VISGDIFSVVSNVCLCVPLHMHCACCVLNDIEFMF
jgi:hypothetical protein